MTGAAQDRGYGDSMMRVNEIRRGHGFRYNRRALRVCRSGRRSYTSAAGTPRGRGGFTLIELLVALAILATGIVVILEAFQTSLSALRETRDVLLADLLVGRRLAAVESELRSSPGTVPQSGRGGFSGAFTVYRWQASIDTAMPADGNIGRVADVQVDVWRRGAAAVRSVKTAYFVPEAE